jgi:sugar/nucleoside kinase (ribokinase family)
MLQNHHGIALVGSCVVDELLPVIEPGQLTYVDASKFVPEEELHGEKIQQSVGGMALNVSVDLAKISGGYPIAVFGKVGFDHLSEVVSKTLAENNINAKGLLFDKSNNTSSTTVLYIRMPNGSVERIFRHKLGAMGSFNKNDIKLSDLSKYKIAMFGYGLLLPQFDLADPNYGTQLGSLLNDTQQLGVLTALDFVSPDEDNVFKIKRYQKSLKHVDICCINDDQACSLTGETSPKNACIALVEKFAAKTGIVHCGAKGPNYGYTRADKLVIQHNFVVDQKDLKGNAGAGDAFSAGILHGTHQQWPLDKSLNFAAAAAAKSLQDPSCTGAMGNEKCILEFMNNVPTIN